MTDIAPPPQPSGGRLAPPPDALAARRRAALIRAHALVSVGAGKISVWDVLRQATTPAGRPLLRLSLRQLLLAQPGVGVKTVRSYLRTMERLVGCPTVTESQGNLTVQWLLDPRVHGRRMLALLDVTGSRTGTPPWRGFPLAPPPGAAADPHEELDR